MNANATSETDFYRNGIHSSQLEGRAMVIAPERISALAILVSALSGFVEPAPQKAGLDFSWLLECCDLEAPMLAMPDRNELLS